MAEYVPFPLDFKEAHVLADLEGVKQDLEWAIQLGNKYIELNTMPYDMMLFEALFFALIIRYGRVNGTGERKSISSA